MIRGYAGVRPPELRLHPDAKSCTMKLPIIIKDVRELCDDSTKNVLGTGPSKFDKLETNINDRLTRIIKQAGDNQNRKTNVKAYMTDWFMQRKYHIFNSVGDIAIKFAEEASPSKVQLELYDIWGAVYKRGDFTKNHDHWPHTWSFSYYVKSDGTTPIIFPDSSYSLYPKTNDIVLFPSILRHGVPIHESDEERIIVSGNIDIKYS